MVKFLIIRFSSIGDIVLTTPVARCIKTQVEGAEVHYLTKKSFVPVIQNNIYIDKIHTLQDSLQETSAILKEEEFDYIIDLHHNLRSLVIKNKLKLVSFSFKKLNIEKWLMVQFKINRLPQKHIVDRYLETTKHFDITNDQKGLDFFINPSDEVDLLSLPDKFHHGYIGFAIGAQHQTKKLPTEKIISIINKIQLPVIILGGKDDIPEAETILKETGELSFNAAGIYNLGQSASLVKQAKVIITHDTGLMHIAASFKRKIISVWGNTIPAFGMYPYMPHRDSHIFEIKDLRCRPCSKIGYEKCPLGHFRCMRDQDEASIVKKAQELWS